MAERPAEKRTEADRGRHSGGAIRLAAGLPLVDSLGDGLWEVRTRLPSRIARTLFFAHDETIILLHGFIKKTRAAPEHELNLARKRKRNYEHQQKHPPRK